MYYLLLQRIVLLHSWFHPSSLSSEFLKLLHLRLVMLRSSVFAMQLLRVERRASFNFANGDNELQEG